LTADRRPPRDTKTRACSQRCRLSLYRVRNRRNETRKEIECRNANVYLVSPRPRLSSSCVPTVPGSSRYIHPRGPGAAAAAATATAIRNAELISRDNIPAGWCLLCFFGGHGARLKFVRKSRRGDDNARATRRLPEYVYVLCTYNKILYCTIKRTGHLANRLDR